MKICYHNMIRQLHEQGKEERKKCLSGVFGLCEVILSHSI